MNRKTSGIGKRGEGGITALLSEVRQLIAHARNAAASTVNTLQVLTNFEIGRRIVEHEQKGAKRAKYGAELLKELSAGLTEEFGKGFSATNLKLMRQFFFDFSLRMGQQPTDQFQIQQQPSSELPAGKKGQLGAGRSAPTHMGVQQSDRKPLFTLSWTHYVLLLAIKNQEERSFYEIEAANQGWSVPELRRQKASALYKRLALSRDKRGIRQLAAKGQIVAKPEDVLREPYVLEFLGLEEKTGCSESDLETAIIGHLESFLLELGKGFLFEARQKRFTFDEDHFFVDLVFYNRLLRCYVVIDLKLDKLTHQDLGQMQMYVNYFDRHVKLPDENPTVGLLLCKSKKDAIVELTLPKDANIHAREYQLYLPSKALLKKKLVEWSAKSEHDS